MSKCIEQGCPLCGNPAAYEIFHQPYCKHFTCATCVEFCIDESSERHVKTIPHEQRSKLSAKAKDAGPNHMLVMREPTDAEIKAQPHPRLMMIAEAVIRNR